MKYIFSQMAVFMAQSDSKRNMRFLVRFCVTLVSLIVAYSLFFHYLMSLEGRDYSFITGFYWTLTVMSTLGFGDITFTSNAGMLFSIVVLFSGILLFMMMLPFIFIRFIYQPWIEAHKQSAVPRELPEGTRNHVLILGADDIALSALARLRQYQIPAYIVTELQEQAIALFEQGLPVMLGDIDSSETYLKARVKSAAMVVGLQGDLKNTNIAATVRDIDTHVPITSSATSVNAEDILELAGSDHVFNYTSMLGEAMARRVFAGNLESNIIASFEDLHIAEAQAGETALVGKSLRQLNFRAWLGLNVVGIWQGSDFMSAHPDVVIDEGAVLLLAGTRAQLARFDEEIKPPRSREPVRHPVLIIGGGKVGQSVAANMEGRGIPFRLLDKNPSIVKAGDEHFLLGDAEDINALRQAGIEEAHSVVITTHSDDLNIYLTLYCRKLRPEVQIISRCNLSRNIKSLYGAGANLVMAISTMAANSIVNLLSPDKVYMLTEGLNIFRMPIPAGLVGKSLRSSNLRQDTQCNVVAMRRGDKMLVNQDPDDSFQAGDELILIGSVEAEKSFLVKYPPLAK